MAKMTKREKRGSLAYWIILAVYTLVLVVAVQYVWSLVNQYAVEYQASDSSAIVDEYMEELNETKWNDRMQTAAESLANDFQSPEECVELVKATLTDDIVKSKQAGSDSELNYKLGCGKTAIGSVRFVKDESKASSVRFGNLPWKMDYDEFSFDYLKGGEVDITIPSTYKLTVNGHDVGEEYITETDLSYDVLKDYYQEFSGLPTKVTYHIEGLVGDIEPVVYDNSGNVFTIDPLGDDSQFIDPAPAEDLAELEAFADGFVDLYQTYFGTSYVGVNYTPLMEYVKEGSELQSLMDQFQEGAEYVHTYNVVIDSKHFDGAYSLGGNFYVINETVESTAYAEYKTTNETVQMRIIVIKDDSGIQAVNVA